MGIWAEIKTALNSTLGTNKFKPLDILLQEYYMTGMELVVSDSLYKLLVADEQRFETSQTNPKITIAKITPKTDGSLRIKWDDFSVLNGTQGSGAYIYKNDLVISTAYIGTASEHPGYVDIIYSAGDVIEVIVQQRETATANLCEIHNMGIYGNLINGRVAEVIL